MPAKHKTLAEAVLSRVTLTGYEKMLHEYKQVLRDHELCGECDGIGGSEFNGSPCRTCEGAGIICRVQESL